MRHLNGSGHGVWLYGDQSFMINMISGKNFVTKVWIIPPDELESVVGADPSGVPGPQP